MRIRSIKPEFWRSEDIDALNWETRLVFIGLWSYVDDNGVGIYKLSSIVSDLFAEDHSGDPHETLRRVSAALDTLESHGQIARYRVAGKRYIYVIAWDNHQRVTHPNKPRFPRPSGDSEPIQETLTRTSGESQETLVPVTGEQGNRGTGEQGLSNSADAEFDTEDFDAFWDAYGKKDGRKEALAKYRIALKKRGVTADLLLSAADEYIGWQKSEGKHPTYTKSAARWLNGEHWNDERATPVRKLATGDQRVADGVALTQRYLAEEEAQEQQLSIGTR